MSSAIYGRLVGQVATLSMHTVNSLTMLLAIQNEELLRDPQLKTMVSMQSRYITVWNIGFQISYFALAFLCDILTVTGRDHMIPKSMRTIRHSYFARIVWPVTSLIFLLFWPFFLTDRELLFPAFIDKMFSFKSNLVIHFCILPAALWELVFLPRSRPKSHVKFLAWFSAVFLAYNVVIIHTYSQRGIWPYPIMDHLYGTIFFPLFLLVIYFITVGLYFLQWKITAKVWGGERHSKKIK